MALYGNNNVYGNATKVGPVMVLRKAVPNYSASETASKSGDKLLAALEHRYAERMAEAQQVVQDAFYHPGAGHKGTGDLIYSGAADVGAKMRRYKLAQDAAIEFNRGLPLGSANRKSITPGGLI